MDSSNQLNIKLIPYSHRYAAAYKIEIEAVSELTIGGGSLEKATSPFDIPVAKMYIGNKAIPYIPASTAKGLLRSLAEDKIRECVKQIRKDKLKDLYDVLKEAWRPDEDPEALRELGEKALKKTLAQFIAEEALKNIENAYAERGIEALAHSDSSFKIDELLRAVKVTPYVCNPTIEGLACELPVRPYKKLYLKALGASNYPCAVCLAFGAPGYASNIHITNLYPVGEIGVDYFVLTRVHVAIDRLTGAAAEGKLFEMEYVTPGTKFEGLILVKGKPTQTQNPDCRIIEEWERGNVEEIPSMLIDMLAKNEISTTLGRRKSAGMGEVRVRIQKVDRQNLDNIHAEGLRPTAQWAKEALWS